MRRTTIVLVVAAMAMAIALPAEAKKPTPDDPAIYTVAIAFESESGIATTCLDDDENALTLEVARTDDRKGVSHFQSWAGARLDITGITGNLAWEGAPISGCHGNLVPPEYFRITLNDDSTVAMLWIFDVEYAEKIVTLKHGRPKVKTVRTDLRMGGPYSDGGFATTEVSEIDGTLTFTATGTFSFVHYSSDGDPGMVELNGSPQQFELLVTLTPN
jgi:hypothetical protein